jgi:hypothetical protein
VAHGREGADRQVMFKNILEILCVKDVTGFIQLSVKPNGGFLCSVEFIFHIRRVLLRAVNGDVA